MPATVLNTEDTKLCRINSLPSSLEVGIMLNLLFQ